MAKKTTSEYISQCIKIHGDKYDYTKVKYIKWSSKVIIICPIHGEFTQTPTSHLGGAGCPKCGRLKITGGKPSTTKKFIEKAIKIHGDKYDYSLVNYVNSYTSVKIICPIHGEFTQKPNPHLCNQGCPKCDSSKKPFTTKEFIDKSIKKFGNIYDYSLVNYVNIITNVKIICPIHGEFEQNPKSHLTSIKGCPKCGILKKRKKFVKKIWTSEEFIEKSKDIHGDKYDYSKVIFTNISTKVKIICSEHGEFEQLPSIHLKGSNCIKCSIVKNSLNRRHTKEEFIEKAISIHGDKYDYSKMGYINNSIKISIICHEHGVFTQKPNSHLNNQGCPKCGILKRSNHNRKTSEDFIKRLKAYHGDKYDYSLIEYIKNSSKVKIICPIHGIFEQRPNLHVNRDGCPKCGIEVRAQKSRLSQDDFIERSILKHGNLFDYSLVEYIKSDVKVNIICHEHGVFKQSPHSHLSGTGCPICNLSYGEKNIISILNEKNISFISQKTFDDCIYRSLLYFDFYLPNHNLCIEYDGGQHFKPVEYFGGEKAFKETVKKDNIKNEYCKDNNINLVRIKYTDFDNIITIIEGLLVKYKKE